jgi:hypothetical protein
MREWKCFGNINSPSGYQCGIFTRILQKCFGCILEPYIMISYTYHILGVKFLKRQIYIWFNNYYMLQIAGYFLILYVPVTEYISEISTRDKHRQIYKLFVHICSTLFFYMCIFRHFECLVGNENYIYKFVVHLNKGHLSFFLSICSSVVRPSSILLFSSSITFHTFIINIWNCLSNSDQRITGFMFLRSFTKIHNFVLFKQKKQNLK